VSRFRERFPGDRTVIGMIHLPPLPDYPASPGIHRIMERALADLRVLADAGFDGVLIENEHDRPHRIRATLETIAAMISVTEAVVGAGTGLTVGCEILLNDPRASLDVAKAAGAAFIRTDYFVDRMTRPEYGEFEIDPDALLAYRRTIDAEQILILADIQVKYATMIEPRPIGESAALAREKGADAVVVTGRASGQAPEELDLRDAARGLPVLIGSGLHSGNTRLLDACDGAIVGTALMRDGAVSAVAARMLAAQLGRA
jgi:membrane complex biogenesis BtpA family protein